MDVPSTPSGHSFKDSLDAPPVVDGAILEAAKENIQPLARGRRATALSQALTTPHRERPQRLAQERDALRAQLQQAIEEDEDPLSAYIAFVDWTVESYPQGHNSDSGLITLFDEATRTLKDDPRYKNDLRYLKLWILYASHVEKPVDMFAFLLANDIGTIYSLLYEEHALALERDGRRSEADDMYRLGINRRARPLERLQTRYKEFQLRMMAGPLHEAPAPPPPATKRKALGQVKSSALAPTQPLHGSKPHLSSNASIQPYVDDDNGPVDAPGNEWPEFGSRASRVKENTREVERAGDVKLKLGKAPSRSGGAPLEIFRDEIPPEPATPTSTAHTNVMTPSKGISEAELLRRDPFRNYGKDIPRAAAASTVAPTAPALASISFSTAPSSSAASSSATATKAAGVIVDPYPNLLAPPAAGKRPEKHMFKLELLWVGGVESCIQEARARAAGLLGKKWPAPPSGEAVSVDFNENGAKTSKGFLSGAGLIPSEPTVTINTKAALAEVYGMFNSPTRSMRLPPMEEIEPPPVVDENAGSKRLPLSRAPSSENAFRPPVGKTDEQSRKRPPTEPIFVTPMQPKKARGEKPAPILSEKRQAFTPFRDIAEEVTTPKASFSIFEDKPAPPPSSKSSIFTVSKDDNEDVLKTPSFQPFLDEDDSAIIPQARTTPSFKPFIDESGGSPVATKPAFQPLIDADEETPSTRVSTFKPFVDDENHPMLDESLSESGLGSALGRLNRMDVMTPITERSFDVSRALNTPNASNFDNGFIGGVSMNTSAVTEDGQILTRSLYLGSPQADDSFDTKRTPFVVDDGYTIAAAPGDTGLLASMVVDGTATMELTTSGQPALDLPNPCNPYSPKITEALLGLSGPDPSCHHFEPRTSGKWASLQTMKSKPRKSKDTSTENIHAIQLGSQVYHLVKKLGEGAFGAVFSAQVGGDDIRLDDLAADADGSESMVAIKVVRPSTRWEFCMLRRLLDALPPELHTSFIRPHAFYSYADESFFVMDLNKHGTLLEVVNAAKLQRTDPTGLDETLVIFFTIELLRVVTGMHTAGFIHGDLKIDNCMVRLDEVSIWASTYDPSGSQGWSHKGIRLIDFGRMLDTRMFPPGQQFTCDWETDEKDCMEIREGRPWTYQTDYFGVASIAYTMLFGQHMDGVSRQDGRYVIKQPLRRYWQKDIWTRFFDILLNPTTVRTDGSMPICDELSAVRTDMEKFLRTAKSIRPALRKLEITMC